MSDEPIIEPPEEPAGPRDEPPGGPGFRHRRSIRISAGAVIAVLTALLGFAIVVQVRANSRSDNLSNLRDDDLIGILDNQDARADRLRQEIASLQSTIAKLSDSGDRSATAKQQAEQATEALGVLLGTLPATGTGVVVSITDPQHHLAAEDLLDVVEELRGAGAEAIQFGTVRVSTDTAFTQDGSTVAVDGVDQAVPYRVVAIGDPKTLDTALNIPGGVASVVRADGGQVKVTESTKVTIKVTRTLSAPKYARPSGH